MLMSHLIDVIPFLLGTLIVLLGPIKVNHKHPLNVAIVAVTIIYLVAQSSWFSAWLSGNEWGREWANYVWFLFNTGTMGIFLCVLFCKRQ